MSDAKTVHNYDLVYLAGGLALGVGLGLILSNREVRTNVKNSLSHIIPNNKGIAWPLGVMTIGGTLAARELLLLTVVRYIKISNM